PVAPKAGQNESHALPETAASSASSQCMKNLQGREDEWSGIGFCRRPTKGLIAQLTGYLPRRYSPADDCYAINCVRTSSSLTGGLTVAADSTVAAGEGVMGATGAGLDTGVDRVFTRAFAFTPTFACIFFDFACSLFLPTASRSSRKLSCSSFSRRCKSGAA